MKKTIQNSFNNAKSFYLTLVDTGNQAYELKKNDSLAFLICVFSRESITQ